MSNNNAHWAKRYGYVHKDGTNALVKRQLSSGRSNTGVNQNTAQTPQSKRDQARFKLLGRPTLFFASTGRRIYA